MLMKKISSLTAFICLIFLLQCFIFLSSADNTHQLISTNLPKVLKLRITKGDSVRISVFNTNAQFQILFQIDQQIALVQQDICFIGHQCSLQFDSLWDTEGTVMIQVLAYQYSYEIFHNQKEVKRQENVVTSFIGGKFIYTKPLQPDTYMIRVSYESQFVSQIGLVFMDSNYIIKANEVNQISVEIQQPIPFYQFYFRFDAKSSSQIADHLFSVDIQLPNSMLKGCDGSNIYDPKIRACPLSTTNKIREDSLTLYHLGSYPTFQLTQQQKVSIKITIIEQRKWQQFFQQQFLTVYIANSSDPRAFYGLDKFQIGSKYKLRQQCQMQNVSCTFTFTLAKGNYSVMPVFPRSEDNAFVYLFERIINGKVVESYHSVLPTLSESDKKFYQVGTLVEFINNKEKLTEISVQCEDAFILLEHSIVKRAKIPNVMGEINLEVGDMGADSVWNRDLHKATIYAELQPNQTYLMFIVLMSKEKFYQAEQLEDAEGEDLIDFQTEDDQFFNPSQQVEESQQFFYLQTSKIQLSIKNGRFPHKKIQTKPELQKQQNQQNQQKKQQNQQQKQESEQQQQQHLSKEDQKTDQPIISQLSNETVTPEQIQQKKSNTIIYALVGVVALLVILLLIYKFLFSGVRQSDKQRRQLVTQQATESVTIGDSSIQISQIMSTETQTRSHETPSEAYSQSRQQPETQQKQ